MSIEGVVRELEAGYEAARTDAAVHDRSYRGRLRLLGPKAREMLTGLVTNDVDALLPGTGCYAAALTARGKIVADVRVFAMPEDVLTDVAPKAREPWREMIRRFVNPRLAAHRDESESLSQIAVIGPRAAAAVAAEVGMPESALIGMDLFAHRTVEAGLTVARVPDFGAPAWELFVPTPASADLRARIEERARPVDRGTIDVLRVEAGRPEWGVDIDENTLAQEANMEELSAISFTKGCYVGQETVARIHFRGHVNRQLRGLRIEGEALPPSACELLDAGGKTVGDVRSAVRSPRFGPIALAMIRREVENGATLHARWNGAEATATVVPLPFAP